MENWKDIKGFEGSYMISDLGNVKSLNRIVLSNKGSRKIKERILKPNIGTNGYLYVVLKKTKYIHRLVAETFIDNINNLATVDHINRIKTDNRLLNLRFLSAFDNSSIANKGKNVGDQNRMEKNPKSKKVYCYDKDNNLLKTYLCAKYISIEFGINYSTLRVKLRKDKLYINNIKYTYNEIKS